jgi:transposase
MMVIGADPHKREHAAAAICAATGELRSSETVAASPAGHLALLDWGRALDSERIWAIEDCRHVSGALERFLSERGERVVRVGAKLMGQSRRGERTRGKSDAIDATAVARAALRQGPDTLPSATVDQEALEIKLLVDHRDDLVGERTRIQNRLRWHLHELWPELEIPATALDRSKWLERIGRRLSRTEQDARVRVCRDALRRVRELTRTARELESEIGRLVAAKAPALLELKGCGVLSAARIIAECGDVRRFSCDAKLARLAGVAPIPASSGNRQRHRLDRGGNRRLNCAIHRIAITQARDHGPARDYLARKQAEGKTRREALRCLKRQLVRRIWHATRSQLPTVSEPSPNPANSVVALT